MKTNSHQTQLIFGNKLRVRVCGVWLKNKKILLAKHEGIGTQNEFWAPPGGGVEFGEPALEALKREFKEETGLQARIGKFLFVNEFIGPPFHALELFFEIEHVEGNMKTGTDPELTKDQIIREIKMISFEKLRDMPAEIKHSVFKFGETEEKFRSISGFISEKSTKSEKK